jgi:hypothetical protein
MKATRLPPAITAVQTSLQSASEPALREKLARTLAHLYRLYGIAEPAAENTGDLRRRRFAQSRHRVWRRDTGR